MRKGGVFLLRLSSSIVSWLWNRIALLNDYRKCSHFAFFYCQYCSFPNTKNHYIARYICSRNVLFLCLTSFQYLTCIFTPSQWYFIQMRFFTLSHFHVHGFCHFDSLKFPGFSPTRGLGFLRLSCGRFLYAKREYFWWSP